jgi:hypothetical protein
MNSKTHTFTFRKRTLSLASLLLIFGVIFASADACDSSQQQAQRDENAAAGAGLGPLLKNQPIPAFQTSQARQNLIEIETMQAQGTQSTSFFMHTGNPDPVNECRSVGMPVPNTTSLSNPSQVVWGSGGGATVGQMDPIGTYVPESSSGTYVICIGPDGKAVAVYWEGDVLAVAGPATWDRGQHKMVQTGAPSFKFSGGK